MDRRNTEMAVLYRSPSLQSSELLALYGREADPYRGRDRGPGYEVRRPVETYGVHHKAGSKS